MTDPRKNKPAELKDDQLELVSGGTQPDPVVTPVDEGRQKVPLVVLVHRPENIQ